MAEKIRPSVASEHDSTVISKSLLLRFCKLRDLEHFWKRHGFGGRGSNCK
jgi:hypothetical protein